MDEEYDDEGNPHVFTPEDIRNMPMSEYIKLREHIFGELSDLTVEELQKLENIPRPRKPFHFETF